MIVPCSCCHPHGVGNDSGEPFYSLDITPLCCFLRSAEELVRTGPKCGQGHTSKPPLLEHRIATTLRRRAGSVISVLPDPRGTRKYVGEKFPLPHGGRMSGERGRKMESSAGKMFLARGARTIRVPAGLVKNKLGGAGRAGFLRSDG